MDVATKRKAIDNVREFVLALKRSRVRDKDGWKRWRSKAGREEQLERWFGYERKEGMPKISALMKPFFHPTLPLIGLNYTPVAHNVLHAFPEGWTPALRLCRGMVFDRKGELVALAFEKFFNDDEVPETSKLPDEDFTSAVKEDGHLGIMFLYDGQLVLTTRGSFESNSALLGTQMVAEHAAKHRWLERREYVLRQWTMLVEIIDPSTHVLTDYGDQRKLVLLGAFNVKTLREAVGSELAAAAHDFGLPMAEEGPCATMNSKVTRQNTLARIREDMLDRSVRNKEGLVVRFASGLRVKFKYATYIGQMVEAKLTHSYLMLRIMSGTLDTMIDTLDAEPRAKADEIVRQLRAVATIDGGQKAQWAYLYALDAEREKNAYYRGVCRKYQASLSS